MPSGRVHARWSESLALTWAIGYGVTYALGVPLATPPQAAAVGVGLVVGILITPDIDMVITTYEERRIEKHLGKLAMWAWMLLWRQYARGIRHRCPLSHAPVRSTLIRAMYLWPVWLVAWFVPLTYWPLAGWLLAGWAAQDTLHWLLDHTMRGG